MQLYKNLEIPCVVGTVGNGGKSGDERNGEKKKDLKRERERETKKWISRGF